MNSYDDIIRLPHHQSTVHAHMSSQERAAQFSPFAALVGYGDAIEEAAQQAQSATADFVEPDEDA